MLQLLLFNKLFNQSLFRVFGIGILIIRIMRPIFTIITLFIGFSQVNAQWYQVNTNTTENLYDIFFVDSLEGYSVGGSDDWGTPQSTGIILKTTDGGENWNTIFSTDSLTIKSIAVVDVFGNKKLYAFGLKNGTSHLVSTVLNTPFQNWSVAPINYFPLNVVTNQNDIIFIDGLDNTIKGIINGSVNNIIIQNDIPVFDIDGTKLVYLNNSVDSLFYSQDYGLNVSSLPYHSFNSVFGQNQITNSAVKIIGDTLMLKGTYPSCLVYSFDFGNNWVYQYGGGEGKSLILSTGQVISIDLNSNKIFTTNDFGQNWNEDTINGVVFLDVGYSKHNNSTFALGKNGIVYKNSFLTTVGINETGGLKKKINIFPNPAKDVLEIDVSNSIEIGNIELFDISGKKAKTYSSNDRNLNISGLSAGTYFLRVSTTEGGVTKKVIIE
ncbi:MAG TPA: T9SS type A sorting domain-containing protein [Bacteroidetes bacterium]|nr:T9SS type A sorting domain-containing protein [Bacteroidota bacterium]